jgi:hypothetical protein
MIEMIVSFIIGFAVGIAGYKLLIISIIGKPPHTACDYCKFLIKKKELFQKK